MEKIRIAFIKFGGLSSGGTERWMQTMAANLPKNEFIVDYFYSDSAPCFWTDNKSIDSVPEREEYLKKNNVNLIKFNIKLIDASSPTRDWIGTDFWNKFDENKYNIVQSAKAGPNEYPFCDFKKPNIIDSVHLFGVDKNINIIWTFFLSEWSRKVWINSGGDEKRSSVIPGPVNMPATNKNLREKLCIPKEAIVAGFHQRQDEFTASDIPLKAFSRIQKEDRHFIIMGGANFYRQQAKDLHLKNIHFLDSNSNPVMISSFLNTLDIYSHGRKDGETFGTVLAEAMLHGLPCLSHKTGIANAQKETIGPGGFFAENLEEYTDKLKNYFELD